MKISFLLIALGLLITALGVGACACGSDGQTGGSADTGPGHCPILEEGDQWEYRAFDGEKEYQTTLTVIYIGKYHKIKMEIDPPLEGIISETIAEFDKNTLLPVSMSMVGKEMGVSISLETEATYEISGQRWPLEVGKEIEITESTVTTIDVGGEISTESETQITKQVVEAIEEVTVEAGTFECFRMATFDESGDKISVSWHSDEVKTQVKEIDYETGETQELIDFSVK